MARLRLRFDFEETAADENGMVRCDFCFNLFESPEIGINLAGVTMCPACVRSKPAMLSERALLRANKDRVQAEWPDTDPDDLRGIVNGYRSIARTLQRVDSFLDIPGGAVALAIVNVKPEDVERGYRRRKVA